jgi:hypothetical protein
VGLLVVASETCSMESRNGLLARRATLLAVASYLGLLAVASDLAREASEVSLAREASYAARDGER